LGKEVFIATQQTNKQTNKQLIILLEFML